MIDDFTKNANPDKRPTESDLREIFNKLDTNGSGSIELDELIPLVTMILQDMIKNLSNP